MMEKAVSADVIFYEIPSGVKHKKRRNYAPDLGFDLRIGITKSREVVLSKEKLRGSAHAVKIKRTGTYMFDVIAGGPWSIEVE